MNIQNQLKNNKGITLIALVITIVLMLILATVTVNVVIDSGLFNYAKNAKDNTEIASEKETIQKASIIAESTSKTGRVTLSDMEKAINKVTQEGNTAVIDNTETIAIKFKNSNRYYTLDKKGKVEGPIEVVEDKNPGDLSKGGTYLGTEKSPYVINCIEDLVEFSVNYTKYESSYVILARDLDFKSIFSYNDYSTTKYGDLNGDRIENNIKIELTKQGDDCGGFTPIASFKGTFDGQGNKICNLYENRGTGNAGLFDLNSGTIKNLGLKNITLIGGTRIGGVVAKTGEFCTIQKCYVEGTSYIEALGEYVGLIVGGEPYTWTVVEDCYSIGDVKLDIESGTFAGIIACLKSGIARRCYNIMKIEASTINVSGIVGDIQNEKTIVEECFHIGDITVTDGDCGGIVRSSTFSPNIKNCYSIGNMNGKSCTAGIKAGGGSANCFNCYSVGKITSSYCGGVINGMNYGGHLAHCFGRRGDFGTLPEGELTESQILNYLSTYNNNNGYGHGVNAKMGYKCNVLTDDEMKTQDFVDELNNLIVADDAGVITETAQNVWKMDTEGINNGYPIFMWQTKESMQ